MLLVISEGNLVDFFSFNVVFDNGGHGQIITK
jgi:hypothetical protein